MQQTFFPANRLKHSSATIKERCGWEQPAKEFFLIKQASSRNLNIRDIIICWRGLIVCWWINRDESGLGQGTILSCAGTAASGAVLACLAIWRHIILESWWKGRTGQCGQDHRVKDCSNLNPVN